MRSAIPIVGFLCSAYQASSTDDSAGGTFVASDHDRTLVLGQAAIPRPPYPDQLGTVCSEVTAYRNRAWPTGVTLGPSDGAAGPQTAYGKNRGNDRERIFAHIRRIRGARVGIEGVSRPRRPAHLRRRRPADAPSAHAAL
jgi:hypothetical protein